MDPIVHEPEVVRGIEVLSFDQVELEKAKGDNSQIFATIGNLNILYFEYYDRFILQLNNWRYALIPRLPSTHLINNEAAESYILPAYDGTYTVKLPQVFNRASLVNFETILQNTTRFSSRQGAYVPEQEIVVRREEEIIANDSTGTYMSMTKQTIPLGPTSRVGAFSSLRSAGQPVRKRDKLKRKFKGMFGKKNLPRINSNLMEVKTFDELKRTDETMAPVHEFKREEIETTIVSTKEIARKLENPKASLKEDAREKVVGIVDRVKDGVHEFKERMAARKATHEAEHEKVGIVTMMKESVIDIKEILTSSKKEHEERIDPEISSGPWIQKSSVPFGTVRDPNLLTGQDHQRAKLRIFDNKYLDQPVLTHSLDRLTTPEKSALSHQVEGVAMSTPVYDRVSAQYPSASYQDSVNNVSSQEVQTNLSTLGKPIEALEGVNYGKHTGRTAGVTKDTSISEKEVYEGSNSLDNNLGDNVKVKKSTAKNTSSSGGGVPMGQASLMKAVLPLMLGGYSKNEEGGLQGAISGALYGGIARMDGEDIVQTVSSDPLPQTVKDRVIHGKMTREDPIPAQTLEVREPPIEEITGPSFMDKLIEKVEEKIPQIKEKLKELETKFESKFSCTGERNIEIQTDPMELRDFPVNTVSELVDVPHKIEYEVPNSMNTQTIQSFSHVVQKEVIPSQILDQISEPVNREAFTSFEYQSIGGGIQQNVLPESRPSVEQRVSHVRSGKYSKHLPDTTSGVIRSSREVNSSAQKSELSHEVGITHYQA